MAQSREQPASHVRPMPERLAGAPISWGVRRPRGAHVATVLHALDDHGYDGWLVLEQDTAITADEPAVDGGALRDAAESIAFITSAQTEENNR